MPAKKTFWERVKKTKGCWLWTGGTRGGYGRLTVDGRQRSAHVVAYETHFGPLPKGMKVCHRCDVPACVRPSHLFAGTQHQNVLDAVAKGRHKNPVLAGEKNPQSRLTQKQVDEIRRRHLPIDARKKLAEDLGITDRSLRRIIAGDRWRGPEGAPVLLRDHVSPKESVCPTTTGK